AVGVDVELTVTGDRRPLSAVVELNAYRIVQEALTNTMKHAAGARVGVFVDFGPSELSLVVRDSGGRGTPTASPGIGLTGMRQRVALLGGSMTASRQPDGGFSVIAKLPLADGNDA
ncbi:MAG: ATP-binding protein, partial [Dermatophilaceae bacterium]